MRRIFPLVLALTLAGCAGYTLVKPERVSIGNGYSVETPISWSRLADGKREMWTVDGPTLEAINFMVGIEDGETLFKLSDSAGDKAPKFRKGMTVLDVREFLESSLAAGNFNNLVMRDFRAAQFGSVPGFRAEIEYSSPNGLEKSGFLVGAIQNDHLHLMLYTGVRLHFFKQHKDDAEKIAASVALKG